MRQLNGLRTATDSDHVTFAQEIQMLDRRYHNPDQLHQNPAFSHGVSVPSSMGRTIYIGGQNAMDASGSLVGENDLFAQTVRTLENLQAVLAEAKATIRDVVKWSVLIVDGQSAMDGLKAFGSVWGNHPNPPAITVAFVSGLAIPGALVEIEAIAVVEGS